MLTPGQEKKLRRLLTKRAMETRSVRDDLCIEWAIDALVEGLDTPSLRLLAGLPKLLVWSEVEHYFALTLAELGVSVPNEEETVRLYLREVAENIVSGDIPPCEGRDEIYRIWRYLDYPAGHEPWSDLDWCLGPDGYTELYGADLDSAIVREARLLLESGT